MGLRDRCFQVAVLVALVCIASAAAEEEAPVPRHLKTREQKLAGYNKWLNGSGLRRYMHKIEVFDHPTMGWGIRATEDIESGEEILNVPSQYIMSWRSALFTEIAPELNDRKRLLSDQLSLVFTLLFEKMKSNSTWRAVIDLMPQEIHTPLGWNKNDLNLLAGSAIVPDTSLDIEDMKEKHTQIVKKFIRWYPEKFTAEGFSKKEFAWAWAQLWSRAVEIDFENEKKYGKAIVPVLDLFNMAPRSQVDGMWSHERAQFVVTTEENIKKGDQIFVASRRMTNTELLYVYGCRMDENPYQALRFDVKLPQKTSFFDERRDALKANKFRSTDRVNLILGSLNPDLIAFYRIVKMKVVEFDSETFYKPLSKETEISAHKTALARLKKKLVGYQSSIEEDVAMLATELTHNQRLAVMLRKDEKEILEDNISRVMTALKELTGGDVVEEEAKDEL